MNFIKGKFDGKYFMVYIVEEDTEDSEKEILKPSNIKISLPQNLKDKLKNYVDIDVVLGIRPEDISLFRGKNTSEGDILKVESDLSELLGNETIIYASINNQNITLKTEKEVNSKEHQEFYIKLKLEKAHFFDVETTKVI